MVRCRTLCATLLASSFAACSLVVDTSGLVGGHDPEAGAPDVADTGAPPPSDGPSSPDATPVPDATPSPDAPPSGCADPLSFCDDFDQPPAGARWTSTEVGTGGAVALVDGGSIASSRFALQASTQDGGAVTNAYLTKRLVPAPPRLRCEFDYEGPTPPNTSGEVDVLTFSTHVNGGKDYELYIAYLDKWVIGEYSSTIVDRVTPIAGGLPATKWSHLVFETDGTHLALSVDGAPSATLGGLTQVQAADVEIELGVTFTKGTYSYSALYDNLVCTFAP